jgi:hypothetical protein
MRIACVAEDSFDEVEITDQTAGAKKRVSMVLAGSVPVPGQTSGRINKETKRRAESG